MTKPRENTAAINRGLPWKDLATLGDVYRGIRSVVLRMNAGRLDPNTGRSIIAGLSKLGDLYTLRLERKRALGVHARGLDEGLREESDDQIASAIVAADPH